MRRRLLNLLALFSLLLGVAVVALWMHSYRASSSLDYTAGRNEYGASTFPGGLHFSRSFHPQVQSYMRDGWSFQSHPYGPGRLGSFNVTRVPEQIDWSHWGFGARHSEMSPDPGYPGAIVDRTPGRPLLFAVWTLSLPCWFLVLVTLVLPAAWVARAIRSHRRRTWYRCLSCGYDLRATPDKCPECGTPARESS